MIHCYIAGSKQTLCEMRLGYLNTGPVVLDPEKPKGWTNDPDGARCGQCEDTLMVMPTLYRWENVETEAKV